MCRYKPTAIKPYKTHRGSAQVPCYLGLRSAIITLFTTGLVKIQTNAGSLPRCSKRLVLRQSRGEEAGPPCSAPCPHRGRRGGRRRCCCPLPAGVQGGGEHSILYCVSGKEESPWKWSKNLFHQEWSDSIRVGLYGCLYLSSLKEIAHTAPLLRV